MKSSLSNHYSEGELDQLSIHIFEDVMGYRRIDLALKKDEELPEVILEKLKAITSELKSNKPIQYILGYAWFAGIKFKVNPAVLIPRQETEELVEWIVKENSIGSPTVVDICSGSGCIGIAIKKMIPLSNVKGIDISTSAIELSRDNSDTLDKS
ncbi:MAG: methyltransferase [Bacteroidetes bacterium]|nr:methyltransferase [Bacteroidota bacterium]